MEHGTRPGHHWVEHHQDPGSTGHDQDTTGTTLGHLRDTTGTPTTGTPLDTTGTPRDATGAPTTGTPPRHTATPPGHHGTRPGHHWDTKTRASFWGVAARFCMPEGCRVLAGHERRSCILGQRRPVECAWGDFCPLSKSGLIHVCV